MSELGPESRRLLDEDAPLDEPSAAELDAFEGRLFASLGLPPPAPADAPPPADASPGAAAAASPRVAWWAGTTGKLAAAGALSAAVIAGTLLLRSGGGATPHGAPADAARPAAVAPAESPASPPAAGAAAAEPPVPTADPTPVSPREPASARRVPADEVPGPEAAHPVPDERTDPAAVSPAPVDEATEEALLLATAEAQLRAGHASAALSLYERALSTYPRGALRVEATAGRIASLCRVGRLDEGRAALARYVDAHPTSPSLARLRASCGVSE